MSDNTIRYTHIADARVSTIELPSGYGNVRYETVVFGGKLDGRTERYATESDARGGHDRWTQEVRDAGPATNADRIEKVTEKLRRAAEVDGVEWGTVRTIVRDLAADPDTTVQMIADAVERPWDYAHLLVIDEDARAGRL